MSGGIRDQHHKMERYYRLHAPIYDITRWTFLFGRRRVLQLAKERLPKEGRILEVGCGTGKNLKFLAEQFPDAQITGLDISETMVSKARKRCEGLKNVQVQLGSYSAPIDRGSHDLVLFSYCLTMINPGFEKLLSVALDDLTPNGLLAVVDFHQSGRGWFARWMAKNHVRMEGHILEALPRLGFRLVETQIKSAYGGIWEYVTVFAQKP